MASVKVAVRVRPINKRERDMNAKTCIYMEDKKTVITNYHAPGSSSEDKKDFTFDYSYWSADSSDKHFASQEQVFQDLGLDVLNAAFEGYNACIFAYGQTGSGKSYSMMGMEEAPGLIPKICQGLYGRMTSCKDDKVEFRTEVSYLEIYNEKVRDLLQSSKGKDHFSLKVREHPKEGPYVQDLTSHLVADYNGIEQLMLEGNNNRTVASTNMNDVSSRSHAIFTINFTQAKFHADMPSETLSKINLVDLAGSERANSTGATGSRLKEGANINKSLVTLGTVISSLADASDQGPKDSKKKFFIPYRNSVLTWLLKDSLGGNAKTIMIAAISPADVNYSETLSTLRYANRAKNIINKPTVNEDPNVRLIRDLRSEIDRLKVLLQEKVDNGLDLSIGEAEKNIINEQLHQNQVKVDELTKNWTCKWRETQKIIEERALGFRYEGAGVKMESELPHLVCIDDDVLSTGVTLYHLKDGLTYMGKEGANTTPEILLSGPGIEDETCIMESLDGNVIMHPLSNDCQLNGRALTKAKRLSQGDVVLLGKTNMFRFNHPQEAAKLRKQRQYESIENLADIPADSERTPSYLFYNAGIELERQYKEETDRLNEKKLELDKQQKDAACKLEEARQELEFLKEQQDKAEESRTVEEEERQRLMKENQLQLEKQKKYLEDLRVEQENARQRAEVEIKEVKERIKREQEEERKRLESEMQRLLALEEQHRKTVHAKELEMTKMKEDLEKKWGEERRHVEIQREQVKALQEDIDMKRKEVEQFEKTMKVNTNSSSPSPSRLTPSMRNESCESEEAAEDEPAKPDKSHIEALRARLRELEAEFEDQRKAAQKEIAVAKEDVHKAEQEALEGLRSLTSGKSAIECQWQKFVEVQAKHKRIHNQQVAKMKDVRELLEHAEEAEEAQLIEKEKVIMERRAARHKIEDARRKLEELEHEDIKNMDLTEENFTKKKELLECETREEIKDIREERKILNELHSKHQTALQKATQMVTETKTKLEKHLENEKQILVPLRNKVESLVRNELGPLIEAEQEIERRCEDVDFEGRDRKKLIYRQRRRIALLERQHNQALQQAEKETLNEEELEELENEREAEQSLIRKEKVRLLELEKKHKEQQELAELTIGESVQELEKRKSQVNHNLECERKKLSEYEAVHKETLEHIETELGARTEMLHRVRDKIQKDKRQLAKLDVRQQRCAAKAAEELFVMADLLEKEMTDKGKSDELAKIKEHRKKLHELDRQLRMTERREKGGRGDDEQNPCTLY